MKVIGAGFGRTGTLSLKAALERIGFGPCYHMMEFMEHPEHAPLWMSALRGEAIHWPDLFGAYQSTTDWPACSLWRELADAYPEAKVVLTVRDPKRWWDSINSTLFTVYRAPLMPGAPARVVAMRPMVELLFGTAFDGRVEDRELVLRRFEEHNASVRAGIPPERLLVFQVSEGWGPLCEFLGAAVPDEPFPHLNEGAHFQEMVRQLTEGPPESQPA